ncbi:MAG: hypothetical protein AABY83_12745 [Pseudomonadota bacterium]
MTTWIRRDNSPLVRIGASGGHALLALGIGIFSVFLSATAHAEDDLLLYVKVDEKYSDYSGQIGGMVRAAFNSLIRYDVKESVIYTPPQDETAANMILNARRLKIEWVADARFNFPKKGNAEMVISVYNANKSVRTFYLTQALRANTIKTLLSALENDLPKELRIRFLELGRVIQKKKRLVQFDLGETAGVKAGDVYKTYFEGDRITDKDGNDFGRIDKTTGIVRVTAVSSVYSSAEILVGVISIKTEHYVKKIESGSVNFPGRILSILENQVAINIGKRGGVEEGSYYAIFRDIKKINGEGSFKYPVGHIRIEEVYDEYAKGVLSIADNYDLVKYTIKDGDIVDEVEPLQNTMLGAGRLITNINGDNLQRFTTITLERASSANIEVAFRLAGGMRTGGGYFASFGLMHTLAHSPHFYAGVDMLATSSNFPVHFFFRADIDSPLAKDLKFSLETGYVIGATDSSFNGIATNVGLRYGFNLF